mgnify:CR=1 FL=1
MSSAGIDYGALMQTALKGVMRSALDVARTQGLPGRHHFYITFRTDHPGVMVANHLKAQYAEEMTVVLQHQFDNLEIDADGFEVTLRFNRRPERLVIPFDAVTAFVDPAVNFALHFQPQDGNATLGDMAGRDEGDAPSLNSDTPPPATDGDAAPADGAAPASGATVVSLDSFRNKK